jgi:hypothetical protein
MKIHSTKAFALATLAGFALTILPADAAKKKLSEKQISDFVNGQAAMTRTANSCPGFSAQEKKNLADGYTQATKELLDTGVTQAKVDAVLLAANDRVKAAVDKQGQKWLCDTFSTDTHSLIKSWAE